MKEFLNEDKKPLSELSPEEMHCVVTNECETFWEHLSEDGKEVWRDSDNDVRYMEFIYRTKPAKKLVIPWNSLKPEYICAAKNKNGSIFAFKKTPRKKQEYWGTDDPVTVNLHAFVGVESNGVDWETSLTFRDGAE